MKYADNLDVVVPHAIENDISAIGKASQSGQQIFAKASEERMILQQSTIFLDARYKTASGTGTIERDKLADFDKIELRVLRKP